MHNKDSKASKLFGVASSQPIDIPRSDRSNSQRMQSVDLDEYAVSPSSNADYDDYSYDDLLDDDMCYVTELGVLILEEIDYKVLKAEIEEDLEKHKIHALFHYIPDHLKEIFSFFEKVGIASSNLSKANCYNFELFYQVWQLNSDLAFSDLHPSKIKLLIEKLGADPHINFNVSAIDKVFPFEYGIKDLAAVINAYEIVQQKGLISWASYLASRGNNFELSFT